MLCSHCLCPLHTAVPDPPRLEIIRNLTTTNEIVLFLSILPPDNLNDIDLVFYEISMEPNLNVTQTLTNDTTLFLLWLPFVGGTAQIRAVAVDRCGQRSNAGTVTCKYRESFNLFC